MRADTDIARMRETRNRKLRKGSRRVNGSQNSSCVDCEVVERSDTSYCAFSAFEEISSSTRRWAHSIACCSQSAVALRLCWFDASSSVSRFWSFSWVSEMIWDIFFDVRTCRASVISGVHKYISGNPNSREACCQAMGCLKYRSMQRRSSSIIGLCICQSQLP